VIVPILLFAATTSVPSETDVMAQVRAGKMLCSNPDPNTKTCSTIDSFAAKDSNTLLDTGEVLFSPDQPITLETSSVVHIQEGAICGTMELADLQKGKVRVNGALIPNDRNEAVLNKLIERLKPLMGRQVCEALRIEAGQLVKYGQVERFDAKLPGKPVSWITPADGYKVAPR
jgi:hypothetical protein